MKCLFILALLFASSLAAFTQKEYQDTFTAWMRKHNKSYHHDEFQTRYEIFKAKMDFIADWNTKGYHTVALNKFSDLTAQEFASIYNGFRMPASMEKFQSKVVPSDLTNFVAPASFDWRQQGAVTQVKNQEQCGSCWSFSTTGSTEGCHEISAKNLASLSEQNLMDCSTSYGNQGCDGGLMTEAMEYIINNHGIDTEGSYPYTAEDGTCHYASSNSGATLSSYVNVNSGDENDLLAKAVLGPVSVAIDASQDSFQSYSSGVYYEPNCSSQNLDHGVLVVGWGTQSGQDYWIVKNSWGADWGMQGYILMSRNKSNNCGIATMATLPKC